MRAILVSALTGALGITCLSEQAFAKPTTDTMPATAAAAGAAELEPGQKIKATCLQVKGTVQWAQFDAKSTDVAAWKPVEVGKEYGEGLQIRTGIRSSVLLRFGDDTAVMIGRSSLAAISQFRKTATTKRTRIGLDYGEVRAGVAEGEGELRSDFVIESPGVVLSKRGTWNFGLWVERGTGRFAAMGPDRGLIEVLQKSSGVRRRVNPKQWVNQAMMRWAETAKFDRQIVVTDAMGQTTDEIKAYLRNNTGRTGLQPSGQPTGTGAADVTAQTAGGLSAAQQRSRARTAAMNLSPISGLDLWPERQQPSSDGDFGTGTAFGNGTETQKMQSRWRFPVLRRVFSRNRNR